MASESNIYEIYKDEDGNLIAYVPASGMAFKLEWGEEIEIRNKKLEFIAQVVE